MIDIDIKRKLTGIETVLLSLEDQFEKIYYELQQLHKTLVDLKILECYYISNQTIQETTIKDIKLKLLEISDHNDTSKF